MYAHGYYKKQSADEQWKVESVGMLLFPQCPLTMFPAVLVPLPSMEHGSALDTTTIRASAVLTWHGEMREAPTVGRKFRPNMPCMQVRDNPGLAQLMHVYVAKKQHSLKSGEYTFEFLPKKWGWL